MGRDNQAKHRQHKQLRRKQNRRAAYDRVLIVSEGSRTEPLYFREIRGAYRLHSANVQVHPSELGTSPLQVVEHARTLFAQGDPTRNVNRRAFDRIYAVFDRDDHISYFQALDRAAALDRRLQNDARQLITFQAVTSIPSFELWLLLHFNDILAPVHRDEVFKQLCRELPGYSKGMEGVFAATRARLADAYARAERLADRNDPRGAEPYTDVFRLVSLLEGLAR